LKTASSIPSFYEKKIKIRENLLFVVTKIFFRTMQAAKAKG